MKKLIALLLTATMLFAFAAAASADGMVDKIKANGKIVVGTEATYPPYEYLDDNANFAGCDIWLAQQIADAWSRAMREENTVRDFIAVGDVQVQAIGSDNRMLSSEIPVRQLLEQIVAKLGIPPFLLGLSWSSTERMSSQQADILTSEIDAYRRELEPIVLQICETYLRFEGYDCPVEIEWEPLTLQDITALSQAALLDAQREKLRKEIGETQDDI